LIEKPFSNSLTHRHILIMVSAFLVVFFKGGGVLFDEIKKNVQKEIHKFKKGSYIQIQTESLKEAVDFVLHNIPKNMIKGIEIIEELFEVDSNSNQLIVKPTMDHMDIKRQIGRFIYRKKRWKEQEEISRNLLANEKIDINMFYEAYDTENYLLAYEIVNADVFAVSFGNPTMSIEEVAIAINSLYIKEKADNNYSKQHRIDDFVDDLFKQI
jgi:hypothetical protein